MTWKKDEEMTKLINENSIKLGKSDEINKL